MSRQREYLRPGTLRQIARRFGWRGLAEVARAEELTRGDMHLRVAELDGAPLVANWDRFAVTHLAHSWPKLEKLVARAAEVEGAAILDVGANIGVFSLLASHRLPGADVHAFEPNPEVLRYLERNVGGRVAIVPAAAGDEAGTALLHGSDASTQVASLHAHAVPERAGATEVEVLRLDAYVAAHVAPDRPLVVKLDVQGAEAAALRGLEGAFDRVRMLLVESSWLDLESIRCVVELLDRGWTYEALNDVLFGADLVLRPPRR